MFVFLRFHISLVCEGEWVSECVPSFSSPFCAHKRTQRKRRRRRRKNAENRSILRIYTASIFWRTSSYLIHSHRLLYSLCPWTAFYCCFSRPCFHSSFSLAIMTRITQAFTAIATATIQTTSIIHEEKEEEEGATKNTQICVHMPNCLKPRSHEYREKLDTSFANNKTINFTRNPTLLMIIRIRNADIIICFTIKISCTQYVYHAHIPSWILVHVFNRHCIHTQTIHREKKWDNCETNLLQFEMDIWYFQFWDEDEDEASLLLLLSKGLL